MADKRISQLIERVDIANNDVLPIVASGATTTNKVTISTIQTWMQDNLDVGVTSVGITIGSSGTDVNVTGSPITTSGNITINIPTASATNRGLLSAADWTTFNNKQDAGNYVTLDTVQTITANKSIITGGGGNTLTVSQTSGSGIALNITKFGNGEALRIHKASGTGNAVYITGGSLEAQEGIFNAGVTLTAVGTANPTIIRNTSGTSSSTTGSNVIGFNGTNNIFVTTESRGGFILGFNNSVSNREYTLPDASGTIALTSNLGAYLPLTGGTLTGALNGTSASFSGDVSTVQSGNALVRVHSNTTSSPVADIELMRGTNATWGADGFGDYRLRSSGGDFSIQYGDTGVTSTRLTISSTGAATFSSSVTANELYLSTSNGLIGNINSSAANGGYITWQTSGTTIADIGTANQIFGSGGADTFGINARGSRSLIFGTNNTARLTISSTGAATFSSSVNVNGLQIIGGTNPSISDGGNLRKTLQWDNASNTFGVFNTNNAGVNSQPNLFINAAGDVGIGTASPSDLLNIDGGTSYPFIRINSSGNTTARYLRIGMTDALIHTIEAVGPNTELNFRTSGSERMRLTSGGDVLMGKTSSAINTLGQFFQASANYAQYSSILNGTNTYHVYDVTNSAYRFYVTGGGTIFATNTTISGISDIRLKENVRDLENALDKIMLLKPREFDWKEGKGKNIKNDRGFIAQEFEEIFPDLVDTYKHDLEEGDEPYKSVRADLIPVLVKAMQEQQEQIKSLTEQIEALKNQING